MSGTVAAAVETGEADLGISTEQVAAAANPWLLYEPGYRLDILLVVSRHHALARRQRVGVRDLRGHALVNAVNGFPRPEMAATLHELGAVQAQLRKVEAVNTPVIRRYVEMGFGIGLVVGRLGRVHSAILREQSMNRHFGPVEVNLIWRNGALRQDHARAFADTIKKMLASKCAERARARSRSLAAISCGAF